MDITENKKSESEIARAAQNWQRTFDGTNHAIWILDKNFCVLQANKVSEQLFPAFKGALIGKHCFEIVHGTDHNATECPVFNAQKSQERGQMDLQMGDRWFEITVDPILDEKGQFDGAVHIINDITRRKQVEEALKQKYDELERFNRLTIDRELRMIALKGEVNALLKEAGQPPRYREGV